MSNKDALKEFNGILGSLYSADGLDYELADWCRTNKDIIRKALQSSWQPIDTAPKDGSNFIGRLGIFVFDTFYLNDEESLDEVGFYTTNLFYEQSTYVQMEKIKGNDISKWNPTHWMPIPEFKGE
jgi:hypothetical protein